MTLLAPETQMIAEDGSQTPTRSVTVPHPWTRGPHVRKAFETPIDLTRRPASIYSRLVLSAQNQGLWSF